MIDTSLIRPECLYESFEACDLCGRSDVKSFRKAIEKAGYSPAPFGRCKLWRGSDLLGFLGMPGYVKRVPDISQEEARRRLKAFRSNKRKPKTE